MKWMLKSFLYGWLEDGIYLDKPEELMYKNKVSILNYLGNIWLTPTSHHFVHTHSHECVGSTGMIVMSVDPTDTHVSVV